MEGCVDFWNKIKNNKRKKYLERKNEGEEGVCEDFERRVLVDRL